MPVPVDRVVVLARPRPVTAFSGLVWSPGPGRCRGCPVARRSRCSWRWTSRGRDPAALDSFLDACLPDGTYDVSAWGPACERVHDLVDTLDVILDIDEPGASFGHVLTAWHANETAAEAVGLFLTYVIAVEGRRDGRLLLVVTDDHVDAEAVSAAVHQKRADAFTLRV